MLADPRTVYDTGSDEIKTLFTKTIFGKIYLDATPEGTITVTDAPLAEPFTAITTAVIGHYHIATTLTPPRTAPAT